MTDMIEERLRDAARDVHLATAALPDRGSRRVHRRPVFAVVAGVLAVVVLALPLLFARGPGDEPWESAVPAQQVTVPSPSADEQWEEPEIPAEMLEEGGPVPQEVRDYWALRGTLLSVGSESGWLCPALPNTGYSFAVEPSSVPSDLLFDLPGSSPVGEMDRDRGPTCDQPPALVLLAFTDQSRLDTSAGITVWPSLTRFEDTCPPESCTVVGSPDEGEVGTSPLEELTIHGQPALLFSYQDTYRLWWIDPNAVPLYAVASGVTRDELLSLAEATIVDPVSHLAAAPAPLLGGLEVVAHAPSVGVWGVALSHEKKYEIDGEDIQIGTLRTGGLGQLETPHTRHTANVSFSELVDVGGKVGLWIPEGGNFLYLTTDDGVTISVEGASTLDHAVGIAENLAFGADH